MKRGSIYAAYVSEMRCRRTGGQLTAGDVLKCLGIPPQKYTNAYSLLRLASTDLGIDYIDEARRRHKLYTWGDVPILIERLHSLDLRNKEVARDANGRDIIMVCNICGREGAEIRRVTETYGKGRELLVIENVPLVGCPYCRESYFTAETLHEIERISRYRQSLAVERPVAVASFA
jgi:YgiT-type zinc finger domain-containing protein